MSSTSTFPKFIFNDVCYDLKAYLERHFPSYHWTYNKQFKTWYTATVFHAIHVKNTSDKDYLFQETVIQIFGPCSTDNWYRLKISGICGLYNCHYLDLNNLISNLKIIISYLTLIDGSDIIITEQDIVKMLKT